MADILGTNSPPQIDPIFRERVDYVFEELNFTKFTNYMCQL